MLARGAAARAGWHPEMECRRRGGHRSQRRLTMTNSTENDIDRAVSDFEATIRDAESNGERTWLCPGCGKVQCLFGQLCVFCHGDEEDYRDERETQTQLRHGG